MEHKTFLVESFLNTLEFYHYPKEPMKKIWSKLFDGIEELPDNLEEAAETIAEEMASSLSNAKIYKIIDMFEKEILDE